MVGTGSRRLLVEWAPDGLLALNRGTSGARSFVLDPAEPERATDLPESVGRHLRLVAALTRELDGHRPGVQLEWVEHDGGLVFVDYSVGSDKSHATSGPGRPPMSVGTAEGPALVVEAGYLPALSTGATISVAGSEKLEHRLIAELLRRVLALTERPVVVAARPYAALSVLIDHVAGFVFQEGALLSHLALLLRERSCPAAIAPVLRVREGDRVRIDDAGAVTVVPAPATDGS
jgi:hypothetical protein